MTLDDVKKDISNALLQWEADGQPTHKEALVIEEKRNAPRADLLKRKRDLEHRLHLKELEKQHDD